MLVATVVIDYVICVLHYVINSSVHRISNGEGT